MSLGAQIRFLNAYHENENWSKLQDADKDALFETFKEPNPVIDRILEETPKWRYKLKKGQYKQLLGGIKKIAEASGEASEMLVNASAYLLEEKYLNWIDGKKMRMKPGEYVNFVEAVARNVDAQPYEPQNVRGWIRNLNELNQYQRDLFLEAYNNLIKDGKP